MRPLAHDTTCEPFAEGGDFRSAGALYFDTKKIDEGNWALLDDVPQCDKRGQQLFERDARLAMHCLETARHHVGRRGACDWLLWEDMRAIRNAAEVLVERVSCYTAAFDASMEAVYNAKRRAIPKRAGTSQTPSRCGQQRGSSLFASGTTRGGSAASWYRSPSSMSEVQRSETETYRAGSSMSVRGSTIDNMSRAPTPWSADLVRAVPDLGAEEVCRLDLDISSIVGSTSTPEPKLPGYSSPPPAPLLGPAGLRGSPSPACATPRPGSALDGPLPQAAARELHVARLPSRTSPALMSPTPPPLLPAESPRGEKASSLSPPRPVSRAAASPSPPLPELVPVMHSMDGKADDTTRWRRSVQRSGKALSTPSTPTRSSFWPRHWKEAKVGAPPPKQALSVHAGRPQRPPSRKTASTPAEAVGPAKARSSKLAAAYVQRVALRSATTVWTPSTS
eukprot:TRINITY_DN37332_c0_g1_i3.p1 TRINITY_DN37332_c0_g1~~TRINITY_DN37332_c0_g1_i3.p1  ORF type:complete len:450 (+),score=64.99 TRINITY_DN37332_c0_g1_i3:159-1508(+)